MIQASFFEAVPSCEAKMQIMSSFDIGSIKRQLAPNAQPENPEDIFKKLQVTDDRVGFLRAPQADSLRVWLAHRDERDILLSLSTGAGKTLVALLAAQSILNSRLGKVLYTCATVQLVKQTAEKATAYGLSATTYLDADFSDGKFAAAKGPCITTYHAAFHAFSKFQQHNIGFLILDDAHTAQTVFRSMYSLNITISEFPAEVAEIASIFEPYFTRTDERLSYSELTQGIGIGTKIVPPQIVNDDLAALEVQLMQLRLHEHRNLKYPWAFVKDKINRCALIFSRDGLSITPPLVPIQSNPVFRDASRRLYLSATLTGEDSFIRTFGTAPKLTIAPSSDADEPERFIVMCDDDMASELDSRVTAETLALPYKTLIMTPSYSRAKAWSAYAVIPTRDADTHQVIQAFRESQANEKLCLVARFDGVDLPGDDCHVMIVDDQPAGVDSLEQYLWDNLGLKASLKTLIASRITQIFGRITRDPRDYGVFLISGSRLTTWLKDDENQSLLPHGLRKQIKAGINISSQLPAIEAAKTMIELCLSRKSVDWRRLYADEMAIEHFVPPTDLTELCRMAHGEVRFFSNLWDGSYADALRGLDTEIDTAAIISKRSAAWLAYWGGHAFGLSGDARNAKRLYSRAAGLAPNILKNPLDVNPPESNVATHNAQIMALLEHLKYVDRREPTLQLLSRFRLNIKKLDPDFCRTAEDSSAAVEQGIEMLGNFLGFLSIRPDKDSGGKGPDVLWSIGEAPVLAIEVKSNKYRTEHPSYSKSDFSQFDDHRRWADRLDSGKIEVIFVGPRGPASAQATPSIGAKVVDLQALFSLAERVCAELTDSVNRCLPMTIASDMLARFEQGRLLFPAVLDDLERYGFD